MVQLKGRYIESILKVPKSFLLINDRWPLTKPNQTKRTCYRVLNADTMQLLIGRVKFYIKELVYRNIEGRKVFVLFVLTNLWYVFMLLVTIPKVLTFSGGMRIFDLMPMGYESEYARSLLEQLGVAGREAYLYFQIPVDLIYPCLFGITYCLILAYLLDKLNSLNKQYFYLCLIPLLAGMFDYLENFGIVNMLISYPDLTHAAIQLTSFFTVFKSLLSTISFILLIVMLGMFGLKVLWRKNPKSHFEI
jgi:hypothetical protein